MRYIDYVRWPIQNNAHIGEGEHLRPATDIVPVFKLSVRYLRCCIQSSWCHHKPSCRTEENPSRGRGWRRPLHRYSGNQPPEGTQGRKRSTVGFFHSCVRLSNSGLLWFTPLLPRCFFSLIIRLLDIVHADQKLYLVFEFLDVDLKRFMENCNKSGSPISLNTVKVCLISQYPITSIRRVSYVNSARIQRVSHLYVALQRVNEIRKKYDHLHRARSTWHRRQHISLSRSTLCLNADGLNNIPIEFYPSAHLWSLVLSLASYSSSRSQAPESFDWQGSQPEASRFRSR